MAARRSSPAVRRWFRSMRAPRSLTLARRHPSPAADHERGEADRVAVAQQVMKRIEVVLVDEPRGEQIRSELIGEELPLGYAEHGVGVDLDRLRARADVAEPGRSQTAGQR